MPAIDSGRPAGNDMPMSAEQEKQLNLLKVEHRDLDQAIAALQGSGSSDELQIARLKKRKLKLRDRIGYLEDQITPDIIA